METTLSTGEISLVVNTAWTNNINNIIDELKKFRTIAFGGILPQNFVKVNIFNGPQSKNTLK